MPDNQQQSLAAALKIHQSGRLEEAGKLYREVLSRDPQHPDANNLIGLLYIHSGHPVRATRHIRRALRSDPNNAQSHCNLGIAYKDLGRMSEAADSFARAAQLDEGNTTYHSSHGNALRLAGKQREAVQVLENAIRRASGAQDIRLNLALAQNDLGTALIKEQDPGQAVRHFLRAIELQPGHAQAQMNLGMTLEQLGELDDAARHYKAAIEARPEFTDAHFHLAHLRTHHSSKSEIEAMKRLFSKPGLPEKDGIHLAYGLGFALESAENYAEAFSYMARAHELQARHSTFNVAETSSLFADIHRVFNKSRLEEPEAAGSPDKRPVFIVGMPRSGTTLAEQVLASHPAVHGNGESMALSRAVKSLCGGQPYPDGLGQLSKDRLDAAAGAYLEALAAKAGNVQRVTDTTPMNFLLVGIASILLPAARFVICARDPMDNCLSIFRQMLTGANEFSHTLEDLGAYYRLHQELMDHWESGLSGRVFRLQYEDLVRDNEHQVKRLLDFCELPFDDNCLKFYESDRVVRSPSAAQVRQPAYDTSIGAWKRYESELGPLKEALNREG